MLSFVKDICQTKFRRSGLKAVTQAISFTLPGQPRNRRVFNGTRADMPSHWRLQCDTCLPENRDKRCSQRQISAGRLDIHMAFTVLWSTGCNPSSTRAFQYDRTAESGG